MRRFNAWVAAGLVCAIVVAAQTGAEAQNTALRPNVVLIITDDVGYGDIGSYGARDIRTPHIDRLAREGVRFTDFYAAPQCTPTRAALITGRYQQRVALERALGTVGPALEMGLPATGRSLPQLLKNDGYSTALVGKWHLGFKPEYGPNAHGFDEFFGFLSGYVDFYTHTRGGDGHEDLFENTAPVKQDGYLTDLITDRAVKFIQTRGSGPFFLEVAYNAAHWPFQPPDAYSKAPNNGAFQSAADERPATRKDYIAMLERADAGVGRILQALDDRKLAANTLVVFTNDNGGEWLSNNAPLFHRKDTLWEGGIRVPAIFRWPGRIPAGRTTAQAGITMDLTATILAAAAVPPPVPALEGINLLPVIEGKAQVVERTFYWRINVATRQQRAVRRGEWKLLIDGDDLLLFNVRSDIGERRDLAAERPDLVRQLRALLERWEKDVDSEATLRK
jgi:arylsulfatase A-like enzyme